MNSSSHTVVGASVVSSAAALLIASLLLILFQFLSQRSALLEDTLVQARLLSESNAAAVLFRDDRAAQDTLSTLSASTAIEAAAVFGLDHALLAHWARPGAPALALEGRFAARQDFGLDTLDILEPVVLDRKTIGHVALRVDLREFYRRLSIFSAFTLLVALVSLAGTHILLTRMRRKVIAAENNLHYLAHTDSVTALPNRHAFNAVLDARLGKADASGGRVALLLIDLDNFKSVNDTLGHHNGDLLLQRVAQRLSERLREDDVLCRIGGDEFAIIMDMRDDDGDEGAQLMAQALLATLGKPFALESNEIHVTASVGISFYPSDAEDIHRLTRNADTAMYQAKAGGKNAARQFHSGMDAVAQRRLLLENGLHKAIARGEMEVHYQTQAECATGRVIGAEALLRWRHAELGMISPAEFIPIAEECGLISVIGLWVLRTACAQAAAWRDAGLGELCITVNLSGRQTRDERLAEKVLGILNETGLAARQLELEITESVLMDTVMANLELLNNLRRHGVRFSVDDFGTGYSSFAYLKRFPLDQLKIDRSFIKDIEQGGKNGTIVTAIIAMAHELGLSVVAEGVETEAQRAFLRHARCDVLQGFLFARPMPADRVTAFLQDEVASRRGERVLEFSRR